MASIKAILKINEQGNGVMESVTTNIETNNISTLKYATDLTSWFTNQTGANKNYTGASVNVVGISKYGTNLLVPYAYSGTFAGGITYTYSNGTFTLNGTSTTQGGFWVSLATNITSAGTYYFEIFNALNQGSDTFIRLDNAGTSAVALVRQTSTGTSVTLSEGEFKAFFWVGASGVTFNNLVIYPMLVEGSTAPNEFTKGEKYGVKQTSDNTYTNSYNGLMFPAPSQLNQNLKITIVGQDILSFNIYFDSSMNQYPTSYSVYSSISQETRTFTNDDFMIEVSGLLAGHGTTEITFLGWNEQNAPIGITYIENVEIDITMDKSWIDEFETQVQKTSDGESIQYGVLANTGSIVLRDKDKSLLEKSKMGYLGVYLFTLELYVNNRLLQTHISTSAPYFTDNYTMKFELSDEIEKFQNTYLTLSYSHEESVYDILEDICAELGIDYDWHNMIYYDSQSGMNLQADLPDYLNFFKVPSGETFNIEGNALELINKICCAFGLNGYEDRYGFLLSCARPKKTVSESVINIPYQKQFSDFDYSILVTNRYDRVFFDDETTNVNYKNSVTLQTNEFFDFINTDFSDTPKTILRNQVLQDYADGIKIAKISVFPSDLYTINNYKVKNWNLGEILEIDDVVRVEDKDGNNVMYDKNYQEVYWRVIDRKVKYEGQILLDLVLQEIKN